MSASSNSPISRSTTASPDLFASTSAALSSLASLSFSALPSGHSSGTTPATNASSVDPVIQSQYPIFACTPASYNFTGGTPPYPDVYLIRSGDANATIYKTLPPANAPSQQESWGVDVEPGLSITFVIKDSIGNTGYSVPLVVQQSNNLSCLPGHKKHTSAIVGGTVGGVLGLAILALFLWFFCIRPARRKAGKRDSYEDGDSELLQKASQNVPLTNVTNLGRSGTYNLGNLDFRPESIEQLENQRLDASLPSYSASQVVRRPSANTTPATIVEESAAPL